MVLLHRKWLRLLFILNMFVLNRPGDSPQSLYSLYFLRNRYFYSSLSLSVRSNPKTFSVRWKRLSVRRARFETRGKQSACLSLNEWVWEFKRCNVCFYLKSAWSCRVDVLDVDVDCLKLSDVKHRRRWRLKSSPAKGEISSLLIIFILWSLVSLEYLPPADLLHPDGLSV